MDIIENNVELNPSLCVETCKSLTEAICKTILINQGEQIADDISFNVLVKNTVEHLIRKSGVGNLDSLPELARRAGAMAQSIAEIRNNAGFASHGQDIEAPQIDKALSLFIYKLTDCLAGFILHFYLNYAHRTNQRMIYEDYTEFNEWFDDGNPLKIGGVVLSASEALYRQDYEAYKQNYEDYLLFLEENKDN